MILTQPRTSSPSWTKRASRGSAMVGLMNTCLGILSIDVSGDHNIYSLMDTPLECGKDRPG